MENLKSTHGDESVPHPENSRAAMKAAEYKEEREKMELQGLRREYREVQMKLIELRDSRDKGIQSISITVDRDDPQAEAFRNGLIELGRKINDEIKSLEANMAELKEKIEAMGGNVDNDTVH